MKCATFNVLADAYIGHGDYSHVDSGLLVPGGRTEGIVQLVGRLHVDVIGLQEAEAPLVSAFEDAGNWQTFWSSKGKDKADGCLTLVRRGIEVKDFNSYYYSDKSGHVAQCLHIGQLIFANTHIKWAPADAPNHIGVRQANELMKFIGPERPSVLFTDCNDRPGGPVRRILELAGFRNTCGDEPTAVVNGELVALDMLAVRGIGAGQVAMDFDLHGIPDRYCPSDHIPLIAEVG